MTIDSQALDTLFRTARSQNGWLPKPVSDAQLHEIYELMKWGPTSANQSPARILFLRSAQSKERVKPHLLAANVDKVMTAPAAVIIAYDVKFYEHLPKLFPHNPSASTWFAGDDKKALAEASAFRNGTLQGAYFMLAARAVGLDCGPISGFNNAGVDGEFFAGTSFNSNFICSIGYGDPAKVYTRSPRFKFDEVCQLL